MLKPLHIACFWFIQTVVIINIWSISSKRNIVSCTALYMLKVALSLGSNQSKPIRYIYPYILVAVYKWFPHVIILPSHAVFAFLFFFGKQFVTKWQKGSFLTCENSIVHNRILWVLFSCLVFDKRYCWFVNGCTVSWLCIFFNFL